MHFLCNRLLFCGCYKCMYFPHRFSTAKHGSSSRITRWRSSRITRRRGEIIRCGLFLCMSVVFAFAGGWRRTQWRSSPPSFLASTKLWTTSRLWATMLIRSRVSWSSMVFQGVDVCHAAIGITNQRESLVAWDQHTGKPLHPAIIWLDGRTAETVDRLIQLSPGKNKDCFKVGNFGLEK